MIIAVASGKGGTGKTTVATSLALSVADAPGEGDRWGHDGPRLEFIDCDVEEPNAYLFLKPIIVSRTDVNVPTPVVSREKCTLCGRCAEVCSYHAIAILGEHLLVFNELCHGCGSCTLNCPENAIQETPNPRGVVERGQTGTMSFAHGILNVGEAMAVPVIRELKKPLRGLTDNQVVVIDSPPGTSCPVVQSLRDVDYALMVTEPTPFGLHDLRLAVEVARGELGIPVGVVVNRDGIGDNGVDLYCKSEGIPILMRIPLDRHIAEACSEGTPLVVALPEYRDQFLALYNRIREEVGK